jgi:cytoskeletal protein CcmA (bactofilin family)
MAIFGKDGRAATTPMPSTGGGEGALSVIAVGLRIVGDVSGSGLLKVDGSVEGSIVGPRQVIIGRGGVVRGNIEATEVILAGTIEGSIYSADRVEVQGTALLHGDISTRTIVVHEGARLNGSVQMGGAASAAVDEDDDIRPAVQVVR